MSNKPLFPYAQAQHEGDNTSAICILNREPCAQLVATRREETVTLERQGKPVRVSRVSALVQLSSTATAASCEGCSTRRTHPGLQN